MSPPSANKPLATRQSLQQTSDKPATTTQTPSKPQLPAVKSELVASTLPPSVERLAADLSKASVFDNFTKPAAAPTSLPSRPSVPGARQPTNQQNRRPSRHQAQAPVQTRNLPEFDFAASNAKFATQAATEDSAVVETVGISIIPRPTGETFYEKSSSFFDNISSDSKERGDSTERRTAPQFGGGRGRGGINGTSGAPQRFDRNVERSKNMDTFGEEGSNAGRSNGNRRGRGRGRGGMRRGNGGPNAVGA